MNSRKRTQSNKKTILHIISSLNIGGTEKYLINLLKETYGDYNNIVVFYDGDNMWSDELASMGVKVIQIKNAGIKNIHRSTRIYKIIRQNKVDIVYSYTYLNSVFSLLPAFLAGVKTRITHAHRSGLEGKVNRMKVLFSRIAISALSTHCLACNAEAGKSLFLKKRRIKVIDNGLYYKDYQFDAKSRKELRNSLGISSDTIVIGTIGRLDENKNQQFLINAFSTLKENSPKVKLIIIGEGKEKDTLTEQVSKLGLENDIIFMGNNKHVNKYYNAMDIFVMSSIKEGFPFVLLEAQINGLAIIASTGMEKGIRKNTNMIFMDLHEGTDKWADAMGALQIERVKPNKELKNYAIDKTVTAVMEIYDEK